MQKENDPGKTRGLTHKCACLRRRESPTTLRAYSERSLLGVVPKDTDLRAKNSTVQQTGQILSSPSFLKNPHDRRARFF